MILEFFVPFFAPGRDTNVMIYLKRRLAMCARKLGKLMQGSREDVPRPDQGGPRDPQRASSTSTRTYLIKALLKMQAYADVQAVLAKYDDIFLP
jgi:hypothetical protein